MSQNETKIKNIFTGEELLSREEEVMRMLMNPILTVRRLVIIASMSLYGQNSLLAPCCGWFYKEMKENQLLINFKKQKLCK